MVSMNMSTERLAQETLKHLKELQHVRGKVERMEARADWLADWGAERRKLEILSRLTSRLEASAPLLQDMSHYVSELKGYLQAVHDADALGDTRLQELTAEHAVLYIVALSEKLQDAVKKSEQGAYGVYELCMSALSMFSQRKAFRRILADAGAIIALVRALSPVNPTAVITAAAAAVGDLADDTHCRFLLRTSGGVGALVRLLQADCTRAMQMAAAAALALLAARDSSIQDSVRYLGGIDYLTDMLAVADADAAEAARCCLHSLRHQNQRNQEDILRAVKRHPALARDIQQLQASPESATPVDAAMRKSSPGPVRPKTAGSFYTPIKSQLASSFAEADHSSGWKIPAVRTRPMSSGSPAASLALSQPSSPIRAKALQPQDGKHVTRFSVDEVCGLLAELNFDRLDVKAFRSHQVSGVDLMDLSEDDMRIDLALSSVKVKKLQRAQEAVRLFDSIASSSRQGVVSDVELRLFLAGQGCSAAESSKVIRLVRNLIGTASTATGFLSREGAITMWEWIVGYEWVLHAFKIYGIST